MNEKQFLDLRKRCEALLSEENHPAGTHLVMGEGSYSPSLVLIGEAPGEKEAELGRPFVGKAGKNLDEFLSVLHLQREEIYITNVVKFRPVQEKSPGRLSNRTPSKKEILAWAPLLKEELSLLRPSLVVTLGNTPLHALAGFATMIGDVHGSLLPDAACYPLFPLYHPAAVIYNRALQDVYRRDLMSLSALLPGLS